MDCLISAGQNGGRGLNLEKNNPITKHQQSERNCECGVEALVICDLSKRETSRVCARQSAPPAGRSLYPSAGLVRSPPGMFQCGAVVRTCGVTRGMLVLCVQEKRSWVVLGSCWRFRCEAAARSAPPFCLSISERCEFLFCGCWHKILCCNRSFFPEKLALCHG